MRQNFEIFPTVQSSNTNEDNRRSPRSEAMTIVKSPLLTDDDRESCVWTIAIIPCLHIKQQWNVLPIYYSFLMISFTDADKT